MPSSRHTLLPELTQIPMSQHPPIRVLGVDDWAWSKGQSFGTILVDLERGQVVDLLPTRSSQSLSEWLGRHPEVEVVSRDRQGVYADGTRCGAPEATQIADRFHLTFNLRQAVERELAIKRSSLRFTPKITPTLRADRAKERDKPAECRFITKSNVQEQQAEVARQRRQEQVDLFQTVHEMRASGMNVNEIANHLGLNRRRFDRWLRLDQLPERNRMEPRPGMIESFRGYLRQRWEAGCRHGRTLLAEIRELGYRGAFSRLANLLSPWRQLDRPANANVATEIVPPEPTTLPPPARQISPQVAAALLAKFRTDLTPQQEDIVDAFKVQCPGFAVMRELVLSFRCLLRLGKLDDLHSWIERAQNSSLDAMARFVRTLKQDLSAVEAAVTEPWSNGPVEGHINRLKTLKRQMYGRAGLQLLLARLLPDTLSASEGHHQT
jgi:transposase